MLFAPQEMELNTEHYLDCYVDAFLALAMILVHADDMRCSVVILASMYKLNCRGNNSWGKALSTP